MSLRQLLNDLRIGLGLGSVFTDEETLERGSFDALGPYRLFSRGSLLNSRAEVLVRPSSTSEVSLVMRLANKHGVSVVPYGGGTGVMGGVVPLRPGVVLDLSNMTKILEIDSSERLARVQPGVLLGDLSKKAVEHGLLFGHDPWSLPIATIGGAISTDSVGYCAGKYGSMGKQVRGLEIVLADGSIVRTRPLLQPSAGPNLNGLLIGSEGSIGILTEAVIALYPQPELRIFATVGFESFKAGFDMVQRLFEINLVPTVLDLTEEENSLGSKHCLLYLVFEGYEEEVLAQDQRVKREIVRSGAEDLGAGLTQRYWEERHHVAERWLEVQAPIRPTDRWKQDHWWGDYLHVSLPPSAVLEYKSKSEIIAGQYGVRILETALWTNIGLFSLVLATHKQSEDRRRSPLENAVTELLELALWLGGGIEYCHGIGIKMLPLIEREWGTALPVARRIKGALDPKGILNPGKLGL